MRAVLDPNVLISAVLSPRGSPGRVFRYWLEGAFDIVVTPQLLAELDMALSYPKLRDRIPTAESSELLELLVRGALVTDDPDEPPEISSQDPGDDYLIALASSSRSLLVSGDRDLLDLSGRMPVYTPADFLALVEDTNEGPI